jgi:hypothetical protein
VEYALDGETGGAATEPQILQRNESRDIHSKRPVVALSQLSDCEYPKCWGPKNHKGVLAQFAVSGLQFLRRAIHLDCLFSSMEGLLWLIGQNKYIEFATPKVMAINL